MKAFLYFALSVLLARSVATAGTPEVPLTLDEAVAAALIAAPQLQAQRATIEGAQATAMAAGRLPDPQLLGGVDNLPANGVDAWSVERDFMTMRRIGLMQSFPNGPKRSAERNSAQAMVSVAQAQAVQSQLEVTQAVAQAWIARHAAELALKTLQALRPARTLQVELAQAALASGGSSVSDSLSAQAAVADLDDRILDAQRELGNARAELARWIGAEAERPLAAAPSFSALAVGDTELLSALHQHVALLTYDAQIAAARSEVVVANAARRPDWSAQLDYAKRGHEFSDMVSLEFTLSLPMFPGTRQDPAIRAKHAAVRALEAEREMTLRMHSTEIAAVLNEWHSARDRVALYESTRIPLARQRSELALVGLRAGRMDSRQTLAVLGDELDIANAYAELQKTLGKTWAYLRYLPSQGVAP